MSTCANSTWTVAVSYMAYADDSCVLNNFNPLMTNVTVSAGCYGVVVDCDMVPIDSSRMGPNEVMHGIALPLHQHVPMHLDMNSPSNIQKVQITSGHLTERVAVESDEMKSIADNKAIGRTSHYFCLTVMFSLSRCLFMH